MLFVIVPSHLWVLLVLRRQLPCSLQHFPVACLSSSDWLIWLFFFGFHVLCLVKQNNSLLTQAHPILQFSASRLLSPQRQQTQILCVSFIWGKTNSGSLEEQMEMPKTAMKFLVFQLCCYFGLVSWIATWVFGHFRYKHCCTVTIIKIY